jgi:D-amino peptidase
MKIYLSADIEGITGIADFRERMTAEVVAACEGAIAAGAAEILVKDAHWTGRNLLAERLPRQATLWRGWSGHPYSMVQGLDRSFAATLFVGWHSGGAKGGNPLAHTLSSGSVLGIRVNGQWLSEYQLHAWTAALEGVPVAFVSGDEALCAEVQAADTGTTTVDVMRGHGAAVHSRHPAEARERIRDAVQQALSPLRARPPRLPEQFEVQVVRKDARDAFRRAFYPGARLVDPVTIGFSTRDWFEVMRLLQFVC